MFAGNDMHNAKMVNYLGYYVCSFIGVISVMLFSVWPSRFKPITGLLSFFGKNSLIVMTTHLEYHVVTVSLLISLRLFGSSMVTSTIAFILVCVVEAVVCVIVSRTPINRIYQYDSLKMLIKKPHACITSQK